MFKEWLWEEAGLQPSELSRTEYDAYYAMFIKDNSLE